MARRTTNVRQMCQVWRGFPLHTSTNPTARTTTALPGMSNELLPGIFLLEVLQVKCECEWENDVQVYECEECYERYNDRCTCKEDHIDLNCKECF